MGGGHRSDLRRHEPTDRPGPLRPGAASARRHVLGAAQGSALVESRRPATGRLGGHGHLDGCAHCRLRGGKKEEPKGDEQGAHQLKRLTVGMSEPAPRLLIAPAVRSAMRTRNIPATSPTPNLLRRLRFCTTAATYARTSWRPASSHRTSVSRSVQATANAPSTPAAVPIASVTARCGDQNSSSSSMNSVGSKGSSPAS